VTSMAASFATLDASVRGSSISPPASAPDDITAKMPCATTGSLHQGSPPGPKPADLRDEEILEVIKSRRESVTYYVRNVLAVDHGYRDLTTDALRRHLIKLEKAGAVRRVRCVYSRQICWAPSLTKEPIS
jgi:hypothetical protein